MSISFESYFTSTTSRLLAAMGVSLLMASGAALAQVPITATGTTGIDASGNVQKEREACMTGRTQQDQATCLREANNAAAEKRSGKLDNAGAQFQTNARQRCEVLTGEDRVACEASASFDRRVFCDLCWFRRQG